MSDDTLLIAGLGNPGPQYEGTRHNVGYMVVDEMARRCDLAPAVEKWEAQVVHGRLWGRRVCVIKPVTYMNLSGRAVAKFADFYKLSSERILVVHDDLDMKTGRLKLVKGGGTGGHKGVESLILSLGARDFYRLKIGVGRPGAGDVHRDFPVEKYVLSAFDDTDMEVIQQRYDPLLRGVQYFVEGDVARAMGRLNSL